MPAERTPESIAPVLTEFVTGMLFRVKELTQLALDEPLIGSMLDSMDILNLILFIEERYDIRIEDDEVTPENFATIATVASLVSRKLEPQGAPVEPHAQPAAEG